MADVDINPFGQHESRTEEPTGEDIPLIPGKEGVPTWDPGREQETSFREEESQKTRLLKVYFEDLYNRLSKRLGDPYAFHFDEFKIIDRNLYYTEKPNKPLTTKTGALRSDSELAARLGKEGLCKISFDIPEGPLSPWM